MSSIAAAVLYVGLFALLMLVLKLNVGRVRSAEKVLFGDGGNEPLQRAIRAQGNAVEDVPIVVLGIFALAMLSAPVWMIHALGGTFFVGRVLHAMGIAGSTGFSFGRAAGTVLSLIAHLATAGACLWLAIRAMGVLGS